MLSITEGIVAAVRGYCSHCMRSQKTHSRHRKGDCAFQPEGGPLKNHFLQQDSTSYRFHSLANSIMDWGPCVVTHELIGGPSHLDHNGIIPRNVSFSWIHLIHDSKFIILIYDIHFMSFQLVLGAVWLDWLIQEHIAKFSACVSDVPNK